MIKKEVEDLNLEEGQCLNALFLVPKKDGNQRSEIILKQLDQFIPIRQKKNNSAN